MSAEKKKDGKNINTLKEKDKNRDESKKKKGIDK
jgi:hypothetical protein